MNNKEICKLCKNGGFTMPPPCPHQEPQPIDFTPCEECRNQVRDPKEHSRLHANGKYCVHSQPVQENDHISQVTKLVEPSGETWEEDLKKLAPNGLVEFVDFEGTQPIIDFIHKIEKDTEVRMIEDMIKTFDSPEHYANSPQYSVEIYAKLKGIELSDKE